MKPFERILEPIDLRPHPRAIALKQEIQQQLDDLSRLKELGDAQKGQIPHLSQEHIFEHVKATCSLMQQLISKLFKEESQLELHLSSLLEETLALQQEIKEDSVFISHLQALIRALPQVLQILNQVSILLKAELAASGSSPTEVPLFIMQQAEQLEILTQLDDALTQQLFNDLGYLSEYSCPQCHKRYIRYTQDLLRDQGTLQRTFQCRFCGFSRTEHETIQASK